MSDEYEPSEAARAGRLADAAEAGPIAWSPDDRALMIRALRGFVQRLGQCGEAVEARPAAPVVSAEDVEHAEKCALLHVRDSLAWRRSVAGTLNEIVAARLNRGTR